MLYETIKDINKTKLINHEIIVKIHDKREQTQSGIHLIVKEDTHFLADRGIVTYSNVEDIQVGHKILFDQYIGQCFFCELTQSYYMCLNLKDVFAILDDDADVNLYQENLK